MYFSIIENLVKADFFLKFLPYTSSTLRWIVGKTNNNNDFWACYRNRHVLYDILHVFNSVFFLDFFLEVSKIIPVSQKNHFPK